MASESVIDIEALCAPVSDSQPAGQYWRDDDEVSGPLYALVDSARSDARRDERKWKEMGLFPEDSVHRLSYQKPDWTKVIETAGNLLRKSKDLWVATWLTEALAREYGFRGLSDGFTLLGRLCEQYWEQIYPRPDEEDGLRLTLAQFNGDLWAELIPHMPITREGLTIADYDQSTEMEGLKSEGEQSAYKAKGVISTSEFEARVRDSGAEFLQDLLGDAVAASDAYSRLTELLDERCGDEAPASSKAKESFRQSLDLIRELALPYLPQQSELTNDMADASDSNVPTARELRADGDSGSAWDRNQAFSEISRQAELFEKYEPNSPVASMLRQAVRLGKLSWREMMSVLTDDPSVRSQILRQTGVREGSAEED